jgi:phosphatidylethanolamine/phosphatidyl-N-methylethanolamine N-methyltransferase
MENHHRHITFFTEFLKHPTEVAAALPSSLALVGELLKDFPLKDSKTVVEFGAGNGAVTHQILSKISENTICLVVEPNHAFSQMLAAEGAQVNVIEDYAQNVCDQILEKYGLVDFIVAGLPYSLMPKETVIRIIAGAHKILRENGELRIFFYAHSLLFPKIQDMVFLLRNRFRISHLRISWKNFPPMAVCRCVK